MNFRMTKRTGLILGAVAVLTIGGATTAIASSDDDASDQSITGPALQKAKAAALAETGGGKVTGTEVNDEESKYEVEVTLENGSQVDVQLDDDVPSRRIRERERVGRRLRERRPVMRRRTALVVVVGVATCLATLAGCGAGSDSQATEPGTQAGAGSRPTCRRPVNR